MSTTIDSLDIEIKSSVTQSEKAIDSLVNKLNSLEKSLSAFKKSVSATTSKTESSTTNIYNNFFKSNTSINKMNSGFSALSSKLLKAGVAVGALKTAFNGLEKTAKRVFENVEGYAQLSESINFLDTSAFSFSKKYFEDLGYKSAIDFSKEFNNTLNEKLGEFAGYKLDAKGLLMPTGNNLGASIKQIADYNAQILTLAQNMNLSAKVAYSMNDSFVKLAADISSLRGLDFETVSSNLISGLTGSSEVLRKYGIDVTTAGLKVVAFNHGITTQIEKLSQSEKLQLKILAILEQSTNAYGNQNREINSLYNQIEILKNNFAGLSLQIGQIFAPILAKTIPYISAFTVVLQKMLYTVGKFLGIDVEKQNFSVAFSESFAEMEEKASGAVGAVKKLKGQLLGIDELNNLSSNEGGGGAGASVTTPTIDLSEDIEKASQKYQEEWTKAAQEVENRIKKIYENLAQVGNIAGKGFGDAFKADGDKLQKNVGEYKKQISEIYGDKDVQESSKNLFTSIAEAFGSIGGSVASITTSLSSGVIKGIVDALEKNKDFLTEKLSSGLDNLSSAFDKIKEGAETFSEIFTTFESDDFSKIVETIAQFVQISVGNAFETFTGAFSDFFKIALDPFIENKDLIISTLEGIFGTVANITAPLRDFFDVMASESGSYEDSWLHSVLMNVRDHEINRLGKIFKTLSDIFTFLHDATEELPDKLSKIKTAFSNLGAGIKTAFGNGVSAAIGLINKLLGGVEKMINGSIDGLNALIKTINPLSGVLDFVGISLNIDHVKLPRVEIPKYVHGGFPEDGLFFANHNELVGQFSNGKTAVANNGQIIEGIKGGVREAVSEVLAPYLEDIAQNTRETANKDFSISRKQVFNAVREESRIFKKSTGAPAFS